MSSAESSLHSTISREEKMLYLNQFCRNPARLRYITQATSVSTFMDLYVLFEVYGELSAYYDDENGVMTSRIVLASLTNRPLESIEILSPKDKLSSPEHALMQVNQIYQQALKFESDELSYRLSCAEAVFQQEPNNFSKLLATIETHYLFMECNDKLTPIDDHRNPPGRYTFNLVQFGSLIINALQRLPGKLEITDTNSQILQKAVLYIINKNLEHVRKAAIPNQIITIHLNTLALFSENLCHLQVFHADQMLALIQLLVQDGYSNETQIKRMKFCTTMINLLRKCYADSPEHLDKLKPVSAFVSFSTVNYSARAIITSQTEYLSGQISVPGIIYSFTNLFYFIRHYPPYTNDTGFLPGAIDILRACYKNMNKQDRKQVRTGIKKSYDDHFKTSSPEWTADQLTSITALQSLFFPTNAVKTKVFKLRPPKAKKTVTLPTRLPVVATPPKKQLAAEVQVTRSNKQKDLLLALLDKQMQSPAAVKGKKKKDRRTNKGPRIQAAAVEAAVDTVHEARYVGSSVDSSVDSPERTCEPLQEEKFTELPVKVADLTERLPEQKQDLIDAAPLIAPPQRAFNPESPHFIPEHPKPAKAPPLNSIEERFEQFRSDLAQRTHALNAIHYRYTTDATSHLTEEISQLSKELGCDGWAAYTKTVNTKSYSKDSLIRMNKVLKLEELKLRLWIQSTTVTHRVTCDSELALEYQAFALWLKNTTGQTIPSYTQEAVLPIEQYKIDAWERRFQRRLCLSARDQARLDEIETNPETMKGCPEQIIFVLSVISNQNIVITKQLSEYIFCHAPSIIQKAICVPERKRMLINMIWNILKVGNAHVFYINLCRMNCFQTFFPVLSEKIENSAYVAALTNNLMYNLSHTPPEKRQKGYTLNFLLCTQPKRGNFFDAPRNEPQANSPERSPGEPAPSRVFGQAIG